MLMLRYFMMPKNCDNCDHLPADCLSCENQIYNGFDADVMILDEWSRIARNRDMRTRSDNLTMCADLFAGLKYCRTPEKMSVISDELKSLQDDERVRDIQERFRVLRLDVIKIIKNKC